MTTTPPLDHVREKFEQEALQQGLNTERSEMRKDWYAYSETTIAWRFFQSAYASGHEAGKREERESVVEKLRDAAEKQQSYRLVVADLIQRIEGAK